MGKGRRQSGPATATGDRSPHRDVGLEIGVDHDTTPPDPGPVPLDVARDAASPLVGHGRAALGLERDLLTGYDRLREILDASELPDDVREALLDRLDAARESRDLVSRAITQAFGADDVPTRDRVDDLLAALERDLRDGAPDGDAWRVGERRIPVPRDPTDDAAHLLVAALAGPDAPAILTFLRDVSITVLLDEDEPESTEDSSGR